MPTGRMDKVDALIASELSQLFHRDLEFPKGTVVTILRVKTARDLRHAQVHLSILPDSSTAAVLGILEDATRDLENELHKRLVMKFTPRLSFRVDHSLERQEHIEGLLDSLKAEE